MLTIVGLGPGSRDFLSQAALEALSSAERVFVRTSWHPVLDDLDIPFESFDHDYDEALDFDTLYQTIADKVYQASLNQDVVYAVPGSPFQAEITVSHLLTMTEARVIGGVSFLEPVLQALQVDVTDGLVVLDGLSDFRLPTDHNGLLLQVYSQTVASEVKLKLMETIEAERLVTIVRWAGIPGKEQLLTRPLYELDHEDTFDHLTSVFIPKGEANHRTIEELVSVTARLRGPGGCAWDSEQTHDSLKRYLIEECYEVLQAIDSEDYEALEDELGDLLFQAIFHAQIASEAGFFDIYDVIQGITDKLIRRHSHVFLDDTASTPQEVIALWEKNKTSEKSLAERLQAIPRVSPMHFGLKVAKLLKLQPKGHYTDQPDEQLVEQLQELVLEGAKRDLSFDLLLSEVFERSVASCLSEEKVHEKSK